MAKVSKDMLIGQLLQIDPNIAPILMRAECIALDARLLRWNLWKKLLWFMEWMLTFWFSRSTISLENNRKQQLLSTGNILWDVTGNRVNSNKQ